MLHIFSSDCFLFDSVFLERIMGPLGVCLSVQLKMFKWLEIKTLLFQWATYQSGVDK